MALSLLLICIAQLIIAIVALGRKYALMQQTLNWPPGGGPRRFLGGGWAALLLVRDGRLHRPRRDLNVQRGEHFGFGIRRLLSLRA